MGKKKGDFLGRQETIEAIRWHKDMVKKNMGLIGEIVQSESGQRVTRYIDDLGQVYFYDTSTDFNYSYTRSGR